MVKTRKHSGHRKQTRKMKGGTLRPGYTMKRNNDGTPYYVRSKNGKSTWNYPEGSLPNGYKEKITNDGRLRYKGPNGRKWNQGKNDEGVVYYTTPVGNSFNSVWELPEINMKELGKQKWLKIKEKQAIEELRRKQLEEAEDSLRTQEEQARLWRLQENRAKRFGYINRKTATPGTKNSSIKNSGTKNSGTRNSDFYQGISGVVDTLGF